MADFDLTGLYKQAFGDAARQAENNAIARSFDFNIPEFADVQEMIEQGLYSGISSALGVPIFMPVNIDGLWLPNEPIVSVGYSKEVVTTKLPGRKGTIKENMGDDDWEITIKGIATNDRMDAFPVSAIKKIRRLAQKETDVPCYSPFLEYMGIKRLVILRADFRGMEGFQNAQTYELRCLSDESNDVVDKKLRGRVGI